ncbi:MAG TPA: anti-sigma factor [Roseiflexaceae bacterium]|nr:anti-sigma factor [Roseiflexaceae bacterium]
MSCNDVRELLALDPKSENALVHAHLGECEACAMYRRQHQTLDVVLRAEMRWEAPAALTAQLLALVNAPAEALAHVPTMAVGQGLAPAPVRSAPRGWYVTAVYGLTAAVIALSLLIAVQLVGALTDQVGIGAAITQLLALPGQGLSYLTQTLPQSRFVIDFFFKVRDQLVWLLLIAVLWAALDKWNINIPLSFGGQRRQIS